MQDFDDLASNTSSRHSRANALGAGAANSSKQLVFPEPTTTKLLTKYFPLFPILLTFKRANLRVVSAIGLALFAMQHWAFVLNPHMKDHLGYQLGNVIAYIMYGSQLSFYDPVMVASASVTAFLVVVYLLLAVTLVLVGCILFHLRPMDDHSEGKGITSDAARLLLNVMSTALLIPILQFCFASCVCGSSGYMWMLPNVENAVCWGSSHIAAFIPSLICLIVLIPLLYLKNTCVYDYAILSDTFQSRRHSVVEKMTFVRDVMSCLLFNVMLGWEVPLGFTILHAIFSAILVLSYMFFLPYYSMWMNRFYVCVHTVECLLCVFVACTLNHYFLRDGDAMMVLFFGCGLVITVLCMFCTDYRINPNFEFAMLRTGTCSLRGGGEELDLSDQLDSGSSDMDKPTAQIDDAAVDALPYPIGVFHNTAFSQYVGLNQQVVESIMQQEMSRMVKGGMGSVKQKTYPVLEPYVNHVYVDTDVALAASSIDIYALKFEPEQLSDLMLVYGANLYSRALTTFADDAEVMLAFASFITSYLPGLSFMGVDLVKRVLRGRTTVDHQFRCLRQANELRVALGIRTHAHSIRSLKARTAHGRALQSIHKFWVKLTEPSVNFKEVSEVADMINERCDIAIAHFESALRNMQTADHVLMRRLGDFFSEVMMAPDAAQECYNEGRDIYEARQARSMRGTRQHTSVEIDVVALSERGTEMLRFHRRGYSSKSSSSQIMRQFAIAVLVLFVIITTCGVLLFFAGFGMKDGMKDVIEGILDAAILSVFTAGVSSFVAQYQALATATAVSVGSLPLGTLAPLFLSKYRFLSSGPGKSRSDEAIKLFLEPAIPFYSVAVPYAGAYSLSTMSELYLQALNQFVNASAAGSISGGTLNELFLISSGGVLSRSYQSYMSEMISADIPIFANKWIAWCTVVFICAVLVIAMVQISIGFALRKTAMSRVFAYQLFTLIPFDALEKLAMESKERYHRIQVDKSFKENADRLDGKGEIANDVEHQYTSDSNKAYVGDSAGKVKSCLKGANDSAEGGADTRGRRVRFNPVVQVVGQVDDKKAEAAGRSDDADEDDAALSMTLRDQQQKRQKGIDSSVSVDERLARISLIVSVALFCVVGLCVIGLAVCLAIVLVTHRSKYAPNIEQYTHFQKSVMTAGFLPSQSVQSTLNFIRSGSLLEFQNCQNFISNLYELIPKLVGDLIPTDASQNLVRMHQLAQLMGNVTLDASVVAAKYHGVSLQYSSNARASDAMDEAELLQKMAKKYPKANATATTVVQNLRGNQDFALQFAYVIVGINIPSFSAEYRKLYFDVVTSVGNQAYSDVSMRSLALTLSLVFPIAAILILALVLLIRPLRRIVELCIPRNILIAAIISFGVVVAVGFVMFAKAYRLENEYREFNTSLSSLTHFVDNLLSGMENFIGFVLTARQLYWFNGKAVNPLATMNALSDSIVDSYLSSLDAGMIQNVFRAGYKINLLDQIGCSLTISSMMETNQFVEAEMIASLPPSNWDLLVEPEYIKLEVHYGENIFYTNKTHDMNLPLAERYAMAVKIVSGPEYSDNVDIIYKGVANLWTTFVTEEYADSHSILDSQNALLYVSLGLCALPIASAIIFGALVVSAIRKSLNLDGKVGDGLVADNRAFKTMLRRSEFGLVSLGILYAATFAMGIWLTQTVDVYANVIAVSTASVVNVAMLSYYFGLQVSPFITYVSEDFIDESVSHLIYDFNLQFVKEQQQSVPVGLGLSTEYDHFVFGTTALASNVNTMTRFITNNCSQPFATEYSFPLVPAAEQPFLELLLSLNQILLPYIDPTKDFAQRRATVDPASLVSIVKMELSLFSYGVNSSELVFSAITNQHNIYSAIYIFLALLAIVGTIVVIAAVIVPIILLLIHEEEAIRMLLHLIPTHVAEEVPAIAQYLETGNTSNSSELQKKFEASEKLLQNILPEKIAARLKTGEQPIADTHDCVTMLFTDFVGFTKRSSTMQAREIVDFLNEVFLEFDTVVELLSLEKIKTIGDAFFMAAGLDAQMRDHALRVVEAGLMFFEALEEHNRRHPSRVPLQMRLGVHSGPVVAGVIGIKKVAYDLWGDSVEIANAMESTGVPGYVHISESTAELVRGFFKLEPRGELPREKEHIPDDMPNTYLVVGRLLPTPYMHLRRPKLGSTALLPL